jgi:hypothetical protein
VDLTAINPTAGLLGNYNSTVYDSDSIVSGSHFVIPSALNGKSGIFTLTFDISLLTSGEGVQAWIAQNNGGTLFNGVTWAGVPVQNWTNSGNGQASTSCWGHICTGVVPLVTNDRYDVTWQDLADTSVTMGKSGCFGLYVLDTYLYGYVVAKLSGDLTSQDFTTPTAIAWSGANVLDTSGCVHSPSVNNTKFIIPASLDGRYVVVGANAYLQNTDGSGATSLAIRKNSSFVYTGMGGNSPSMTSLSSGTFQAISCATQAIQVSTGDFFETVLFVDDTSTDLIAARSNMWMMIVG